MHADEWWSVRWVPPARRSPAAGKYVPSIGHFILQQTAGEEGAERRLQHRRAIPPHLLASRPLLGEPPLFKLQALAIGNGLTDPAAQARGLWLRSRACFCCLCLLLCLQLLLSTSCLAHHLHRHYPAPPSFGSLPLAAALHAACCRAAWSPRLWHCCAASSRTLRLLIPSLRPASSVCHLQVMAHADTAYFQGYIDPHQRVRAMTMQLEVVQLIAADEGGVCVCVCFQG